MITIEICTGNGFKTKTFDSVDQLKRMLKITSIDGESDFIRLIESGEKIYGFVETEYDDYYEVEDISLNWSLDRDVIDKLYWVIRESI